MKDTWSKKYESNNDFAKTAVAEALKQVFGKSNGNSLVKSNNSKIQIKAMPL